MSLFNRPNRAEVAAVYGVIVLLVYGWTLLWFFWKLPSWLYFLSLGEIAGILAYALTVNLLESLLVLLLPLGLAFFLPRRWFYQNFLASAAALSMMLLGYLMLFIDWINEAEGYPKDLFVGSIAAGFGFLLLAIVLGNLPLPRKILASFAERASVFIYLSLPASLLSLVFILVRNLL